MEQTIKNSHGTERWQEKAFLNHQTKVNVNDKYLIVIYAEIVAKPGEGLGIF